MPLVGQTLHFTFRPNPADQYTFSKLTVDIQGIDTEKPIQPQLEEIDRAQEMVWQYILERVDNEIADVLRKANED